MERSRLKNIIIFILVLVNCFLLASLGLRSYQGYGTQKRMARDLTALFAADGVQLDGAAVPTQKPLPGGVLSRSTETDRAVAAFLLGDKKPVRSNEGGGIYTYTAASGQATFRSGGSFDVSGALDSGTDLESFCRRFCRTFGYQKLKVGFSAGSGTAIAVQYRSGCPVVNATVTFQAENGALVSVSGIHLPDAMTPDTAVSMTAATALTAFLDARRESGDVVSAVTDVYLCFQLQSTTAAPMVLSPAWCIATDTGNYYVNCSSGAVTRG